MARAGQVSHVETRSQRGKTRLLTPAVRKTTVRCGESAPQRHGIWGRGIRQVIVPDPARFGISDRLPFEQAGSRGNSLVLPRRNCKNADHGVRDLA
jgi:hypothetical protein